MMIEQLKGIFKDQFEQEPTLISKAPGRINLIGEHTDYNQGLVFPAAIDKYMYFAFRLNQTQQCNLYAGDKNSLKTIDLSNLVKTERLWANYLTGILHTLHDKELKLLGFDCAFISEVPVGSGLSSSAALECGFITGLNELFRLELSPWEMVNICNQSDNHFLGIQSGILDQFSSIFGKKDQAMQMNCQSREYDYVDIPIDPYQFILINTCVKHSHVDSGYNDRVAECTSALEQIQKQFPNVGHLSETTSVQLDQIWPQKGGVTQRRASFVLNENKRVKDFEKALEQRDLKRCGQLLYASHHGLQHNYEVSCAELDYLVRLTDSHDEVLGARMMGGGFGGCTLNLVHQDFTHEFVTNTCQAYAQKFGITPEVYQVNIADGAGIVS